MSPTSAGRAALLLTAVLAAGCAGGAAVKSLETLNAPDGGHLFRDLCASCHGADGRGDGPLAEHLKATLPDLTRLAARHGGTFPRAEVAAILNGERAVPSHGPLTMPVWGRQLAPSGSPAAAAAEFDRARDVTALLDYLASIQRTGG